MPVIWPLIMFTPVVLPVILPVILPIVLSLIQSFIKPFTPPLILSFFPSFCLLFCLSFFPSSACHLVRHSVSHSAFLSACHGLYYWRWLAVISAMAKKTGKGHNYCTLASLLYDIGSSIKSFPIKLKTQCEKKWRRSCRLMKTWHTYNNNIVNLFARKLIQNLHFYSRYGIFYV